MRNINHHSKFNNMMRVNSKFYNICLYIFICLIIVNLDIVTANAQTVVRGPYLQNGTTNGVSIMWRTDTPTVGKVWYGSSVDTLHQIVDETLGGGIDHLVRLDFLTPNTKYFYQIGTDQGTVLAGGDTEHYFYTNPYIQVAQPVRIWAIGDSGTANTNAQKVRDAYLELANTVKKADLWLMLGDNAYSTGMDTEYQNAVFNIYPTILRNTILWSTQGNHDYASNAYYNVFDLPTTGEGGGLASGTEQYYSFDYANIHFICLNSQISSLSGSPSSVMYSWLQEDLLNTSQDWIIAYFHHPPYTKGSHDSDNFSDSSGRLFYMRENALPILEAGGVDLVLCGHSHSYERSFFISGHYGASDTFYSPTHVVQSGDGKAGGDGAYMKTGTIGTVYIVGGSSGKVAGTLTQHNAMQAWLYNLGSVVIDVDGLTMNVSFLRELTEPTQIDDYFTISKLQVQPPGAPTNLTAAAVSGNQINLSWSDVLDETGYKIRRSEDEQNWSEIATTGQNATTYNDTNNLQPSTTYYYQVEAYNNGGNSPPSNTASATAHPTVEYFATGETAVSGQVSGNYTDTWNDDGNIQVITEVENGGKPSRRYSYLEHKWHFNVSSGFSVTFYANAYKNNSSEDNFTFQYSTDGQNFVDIAEVNSTATDNLEVWQLPTTINGQVDIRVIDSDRTNGNRSLESIYVDKLYILIESDLTGTVPAPPSSLMTTAVSAGHVSLSWVDNSTDENGFQIERSIDGASWTILNNVAADSTTYEDYTVISNTTYYYRVNAYNGSGASDYATSDPVTTPDVIELFANGYKVKGVQHVDLTWNILDFSQTIDIYRNGVHILVNTANNGVYTDNIGSKGKGVYTYQICESSSIKCSNTADVKF